MTEPKKLIPDAAIGIHVNESFILAAHPDERKTPQGTPSYTRRTLVLRFDGDKATIATSIPEPLVRAWSSASGQAYCAPVKGNYVYTYHNGKWNREEFSQTAEQITFMSG